MASENFRGGCRCRDARCLRRCEPGHFDMGSKTDDETRAGVRYYFGVFPESQDLRHVLYTLRFRLYCNPPFEIKTSTVVSALINTVKIYQLTTRTAHAVRKNISQLTTSNFVQIPYADVGRVVN